MSTKHAVLIAALIWAAIFLPGLGSTELKGEEWRRVLPGRTMLQTGNWVVIYSGGRIYNRKPPLVNWAAATSFRLTGKQDEWSARLPSVLAVLLLILVTMWTLRGWLGAGGALAASIFMMTNISLLEKGRLAEIEPLYIAFYGIAILTWVGCWQRKASPWLTWGLPGLALGVATLAKGPAPLLLYYYIPILCVLTRAKRLRELIHPAHFAGIGLMLLVFLPWALTNMQMNPAGDSASVWKEQLTSRLGLEEMRPLAWLMQPVQALANFLPWVLFLPLVWIRKYGGDALSVESDRDRALVRGMRLGLVISFVLIALLPASRPRFTLPLLVPASVLVAWVLVRCRSWRASRPGIIWSAVVTILGWVLFVSVLGAAAFAGWKGEWGLVAAAIPGVAFGIWAWRRSRAGTGDGLAVASGGLACMAISVLVMAAFPLMREKENIRPFGEAVVSAAGGRELAAFKIGEKPFVFYLGAPTREIARFSELPDSIRAVLLPAKRLEKERKNLVKKFGEPEDVKELSYSRSGKLEDLEEYVLLNFAGLESGELPGGG